jgi:hypothetical protein
VSADTYSRYNLLEANALGAQRDFVSSLRSAILKSVVEFLSFPNAIFTQEVEVAVPC